MRALLQVRRFGSAFSYDTRRGRLLEHSGLVLQMMSSKQTGLSLSNGFSKGRLTMNKSGEASQLSGWDDLVPTFPITLHFDEGKTFTISVRPLSIEGWAQVFSWIRRSQDDLRRLGVRLDSLQDATTLVDLLQLLLSTAPSLLAMASGLSEQAVRDLPASAALDLLEGLLDVNQRSLDRFQQRMQSLVGKLMRAAPVPVQAPATLS